MTTTQDDPEARKRAIADVFGRGAESYDQVGVDFFTPAARDLVARARVRPGERVLDVGTGRGAVLFAAAEAVGASGRAVGTDLSTRMAELTQADARARGLDHVTAVPGDAERPEFPDGSFDVVLAGLVIHFLPAPATALGRYAALLAPRGRLGFTTFGAQDPNFDAAMRAIGGFVPGGMPPRADRRARSARVKASRSCSPGMASRRRCSTRSPTRAGSPIPITGWRGSGRTAGGTRWSEFRRNGATRPSRQGRPNSLVRAPRPGIT
jgi:ubiquinone/menaquinone biosynthesis C-methylase UbiE